MIFIVFLLFSKVELTSSFILSANFSNFPKYAGQFLKTYPFNV